MKKLWTILGVTLMALAALAAMSVSYSKEMFSEAHIKRWDSDLLRLIEVVPFDGDREIVTLYETESGIGLAHFKRLPLLNKWQLSERNLTLFDRGIIQNYAAFKVEGGQKDFAIVYGAFAPMEDYNLPIRLRNLEDSYDEKPFYIENRQQDVIWYQYLNGPSANPERFEVYNEITGTVIK